MDCTHSDAEPAWPMLLLEGLMMYVYVCRGAVAAATQTANMKRVSTVPQSLSVACCCAMLLQIITLLEFCDARRLDAKEATSSSCRHECCLVCLGQLSEQAACDLYRTLK